MQASTSKALRRLHLVLDAAVIVTAMLLAASAHGALRGALPLRKMPDFHDYAALAYLTPPLWLALVVGLRLDRSFETLWAAGPLLLGLTKLHAIGLTGLTLIHFFAQTTINRTLVATFLVCSFALMYGLRVVLNQRVRYQHRQGVGRTRLLLIGGVSRRMADFVRDARARPLPPRLVGCLSTPEPASQLSTPPPDFEPLPQLGALSVERFAAVLHDEAIDEVLFFPPCNRPEELTEYIAVCEELGIRASFSVSLVQVARARPQVSSIFERPFVTFDIAPKQAEWLAVKHGLDAIAAALLLLLLAPLLALTALAILISMGRPIFFTQPRAGLNGQPFTMFKFRSMVAGAEVKRDELAAAHPMNGPVFKLKDDPRVTPLGRILRRTSIDELPQLVNVALGSMSLVGPRPLPLSEQRHIRNWQRRRLSMKPGITGLWQVSGRSELDFEEWMALDLKYVDEWSLWLDAVILLRTIPVVLFGRGAH